MTHRGRPPPCVPFTHAAYLADEVDSQTASLLLAPREGLHFDHADSFVPALTGATWVNYVVFDTTTSLRTMRSGCSD